MEDSSIFQHYNLFNTSLYLNMQVFRHRHHAMDTKLYNYRLHINLINIRAIELNSSLLDSPIIQYM